MRFDRVDSSDTRAVNSPEPSNNIATSLQGVVAGSDDDADSVESSDEDEVKPEADDGQVRFESSDESSQGDEKESDQSDSEDETTNPSVRSQVMDEQWLISEIRILHS